MNTQEYKFTFETDEDLRNAERTGYIDAYDCVRMEIKQKPDAGSIDFPVKSREDYMKMIESDQWQIVTVYPTVHSYDIQDYL
jgi:hypothetical protein